MAFVGVFRSLDNIDQFVNSLFDGAYFAECNVVFVGIEKDFIARIEIFLMGRDGFLELRLPWNESIEDGLDFLRILFLQASVPRKILSCLLCPCPCLVNIHNSAWGFSYGSSPDVPCENPWGFLFVGCLESLHGHYTVEHHHRGRKLAWIHPLETPFLRQPKSLGVLCIRDHVFDFAIRVPRVSMMESSKTSVILGMSRD